MGASRDDSTPVGAERCVRYEWAARVTAGGRVLDAACGGGWGTAVLARDASAVGLDLSPAAIADARARYGDRAEFSEGNLHNLPFGTSEFDHAVCFEALAHVADTAAVIDELRRVLRPGGTLLLSSPNFGVYPRGNPLHLNELGPVEVERLLTERFARVATHRQQTYQASLLCDDATLARSDTAEPLDVEARKTTGGPPGSELHTILAATDGELPPSPAWLGLGEDVDYATQRRELEEWRERAVRAEASALALERELRSLRD